jgi:hypothetical protein
MYNHKCSIIQMANIQRIRHTSSKVLSWAGLRRLIDLQESRILPIQKTYTKVNQLSKTCEYKSI